MEEARDHCYAPQFPQQMQRLPLLLPSLPHCTPSAYPVISCGYVQSHQGLLLFHNVAAAAKPGHQRETIRELLTIMYCISKKFVSIHVLSLDKERYYLLILDNSHMHKSYK
jgi:hypothetical protein